MSSKHRPLSDAQTDRDHVRHVPQTPQTMAPSYRLSFDDPEFLQHDALRPVRLQLEMLKPEMILDAQGVNSTVVMFGGARIVAPQAAHTARTPKLAELARYYEEARHFAELITRASLKDGGHENVIVTGGGPGVMEAGNKGAQDAGGRSIGLGIVLPFETAPNAYVTPELSFNFHYFSIRKMHFLLRAAAITVFPGGFGTLDELFEALTLIQTQRMQPVPVILFGKAFWDEIIDWDVLASYGTISAEDLDLLTFVETAEEAVAAINAWHPPQQVDKL